MSIINLFKKIQKNQNINSGDQLLPNGILK